MPSVANFTNVTASGEQLPNVGSDKVPASSTVNSSNFGPTGAAKNAPTTTIGGVSPTRNRKHRPPAKKQMGSVFRYLTDVNGSALSDIVGGGSSITTRAQSAPSDPPGGGAGGGSTRSPHRSPRTGGPNNTVSGMASRPQAEGKMRLLDEYIGHFPLDRPQSAAPLQVKGGADNENNAPAKGHKQAILDQEIKKYEQDAQTRKSGKEAATKTFNNLRKKQNFEGWLSVSERNNRKMRRENDALAKLAQIAQENCIDNDSKYEEVLSDLRNNVELAALIRRNDDPNLKLMQTQFEVIDRRIDDICETAKEQVATEYVNLKSAFEKQVHKQAERLDAVRESGKTTTEQWRQRNNDVQQSLVAVLQRLIDADEEKKVLEKDLQKLRVAYGAQENDGTLLEKDFFRATKRHQQLKERMQALEVLVSNRHAANFAGGTLEDDINSTTRQLIQESGQVGATLVGRDDYQRRRGVAGSQGGIPPTNPFPSAGGGGVGSSSLNASSQILTDAEKRQKEYAQTLQNAEELLETEAQNLRSIRHTHAAALKQRTELEVFLLQAILYQRQWKEHKIKEGSIVRPHQAQIDDTNAQSAELVFTAEDRKKVIERLLSQDRVIRLLYGQPAGGDESATDPSTSAGRPLSTGTNPVGRSIQAMTPSVAAQSLAIDQGEVGQLWEKWRRWTQSAQSAMHTQHLAEQSKE